MSQFEKELPPFRLAETHHGDDLQRIAARELGDANRWAELVWINSLDYPYLTNDEQQAGKKVLLNGSLIRIPSVSPTPTSDTERAQVFGRDCLLEQKRLDVDEGGDIKICAGTQNLKQQLKHAVITPRGQLMRHPGYGCLVWSLYGTVQGPTAELLGATYVKATVEADYRVNRVLRTEARTEGDALYVDVIAEAIDGGAIDITNRGA